VVNLYTREYSWRSRRLAPGDWRPTGLPVPQFKRQALAQWCAPSATPFPDCTLGRRAAQLILLGGREFGNHPSAQHFSRLWRDRSRRRASLERARVSASSRHLLADAEELRRWCDGTPALTDDHPKRIARTSLENPMGDTRVAHAR